MPMVASFEGYDHVAWTVLGAAFLLLTWVASALLALVAVVSVFRQRPRRVAWKWARACMLVSIPVGLFDVWLLLRSNGPAEPAAVCAILIIPIAPRAVGECVSCLASRAGRTDGGPVRDG